MEVQLFIQFGILKKLLFVKMNYTISHIASIIQSKNQISSTEKINYLLIDSRKIVFPNQSLFFALIGARRNGHDFIEEAYERGVRNFVISEPIKTTSFADANFLIVDNTLTALQTIASYHRKQFQYPVIGITGSNGKTIVKEWLNQLLQPEFHIIRSPRSYNSQIGVPLSVWQMNAQHTLAIFEAGISTIEEMSQLEAIIQPTIGIHTNIGEAHSKGFRNKEEKLKEKIKLFKNCTSIIYCKEDIEESLLPTEIEKFSWSRKTTADFFIKEEIKKNSETILEVVYKNQSHTISIPFTDAASIDNSITCCCTLLQLGYNFTTLAPRLQQLQAVEMRLQLKKGINNCTIINDSYSNDISSLSIALDYLTQQAGNHTTTVILSDILQSEYNEETLYQQIATEFKHRNIQRLIGIGETIFKYKNAFNSIPQTEFFISTENFLTQQSTHQFKNEFILLKGARIFSFERINNWLEQKVHQTVLEINLSAIAHNLKEYQKHLLPSTKLMAMVKAFSYGSGNAEIARVLQFHKVDYLAVAYTDEGIDLRNAGISLPIMVMNIDEAGFDAIIEYNLEPEIYSFPIYQSFHKYLQKQAINNFPVHIKINTGMNRLGFDLNEIQSLSLALKQNNTMTVKSVLSHLAASDNSLFDDFTFQQATLLNNACELLQNSIGYTFIKHIANSAAIFRHQELQMDMVRLGIGLYGIDITKNTELNLATVATLKSTIAQIRNLKAGETVGYNRNGKINKDSTIAIIRIGYADGLSRKMGNGNGYMFLKNTKVPIIGDVCMDMTMIDITGILEEVKEGDEVEIFGRNININTIASSIGTIPYEVMTGVNQRVKRIYLEE